MYGYKINNGDISTMTPLQKFATAIMVDNIFKWKIDKEPMAVI